MATRSVTRQQSADIYLHQPPGREGTWYARVRVPPSLCKYVGQTHILQSLKTTDKATANLRKHEVVGKIKGELERLRKTPERLRKAPEKAKAHGISFAEARAWREELIAAEGRDDGGDLHGVILELATRKAEELERLYDTNKASRWFKAATTTADTLPDLMDKWLEVSDYKPSTNAGHRKALAEVLQFVGNDHAVPADIDRKKAMSFIDTDLTQRGLAHSTIRDRLVSLGGFWGWMQSRDAVPAGVNPWTDHKVSKQSNKGRSPEKRTYTDAELVKLLAGNDTVRKWPTTGYIPDLIVLGMFTGCRLEELCSLTAEKVTMAKGHAVLNITDAKTKAGVRPVGITHAAPLAVLKRRLKAGKGMFPDTYSQGSAMANSLETSRKVRYSPGVEKALAL